MKTTTIFSTLLIQVHLVCYGWSALPPPGHVTMDSVNMKHVLKWRPPPAPCSTPLLYSVQFQGEFELTVMDGIWVDSPECQDMTRTHCDQTLDLGSDSDYNIRVRARCASQTSEWAQLSPPFNRRDTLLTVPLMTVSAVGDALLVSFEQALLTASIEVEVWKHGNAPGQGRVFAVPAAEKLLHVADLQDRSLYCVRARVLMKEQLLSQDTQEQCVHVSGPHAPWKSPTTAVLTLLLMVGVAFSAVWCVVQCRTRRSCRNFQKEPLPHSLLHEGAAPIMPDELKEEVCIDVRVVSKDQRLQPGHNAHG
ncbi:interleukin-20 receptor subunit beta [Hippocampus comes]|uniref:Interleukin-20 receptor subunit beta-like n=1 Tax=Hippocampus comes TaxID=109280 RepID=A0A3Q2XXB4_HIPCM|nr:PREDICTED: interleukin-20 receptor subunit beta-like [Hippocampus comes]